MATTTNYGWTTPDDTDLVKDGAAAIRTLGSSADTTVKNLNPGTTAGDIDYYTSGTAKARVAIGTAGQVLQVNAGATAPEWATPAGGSDTWTSVTSSALSGLSTITISSLTYNKLVIWAVDTVGSNTSADMRVRFNGSTTLADYDQGFLLQTTTALRMYSYPGLLSAFDVADVGGTGGLWLNLENGTSTSKKRVSFVGGGNANTGGHFNGYGYFNGSAAITSVTVFLDSGTWSSGTLNVYGA
jgi:hypothetical protein